MRPSQKGWINQYLQLIVGQKKANVLPGSVHEQSDRIYQDHELYKFVQPTGLMYGHPVCLPPKYSLKISNWDDTEKMKFILLDSLVNGSLIINSDEIKSDKEFSDCIWETLTAISNFYRENRTKKSKPWVLRKKPRSKTDDVEIILNKRLQVKSKWNNSFWAGFFENSLLFLDVY